MHKHRKKQYRKPSRFANANYELSDTAQSSVRGVVDSIDGGKDFAFTYLREEFTTKYCDEALTPADERRASAVRKFRECEVKNASTNLRFVGLDPEYNLLPRVTKLSFLRFARRFIRDILGPLHNELVLGSFSGGASTSRRRTDGHPSLKFVGKADVTEGAVKFVDIIHHESELFRQYGIFYELNIVEGNVLFTVPKKSDIDRCACKEPDINMFLQKGVGDHIRRRLRRCGINLNDQSINRDLARVGSEDSSLATLDLSSASDTISIEVVRALLPPLWFDYLNDIRSHKVVIDGETTELEMFSSMGNGFTFELESLIFYVLMRATSYFTNTPGIISVYGDDLIIPSGMYDDASWILNEFGFSLNSSKSFHTGPFRESCGGHYYNGDDVTPFYLKRQPTRLTDVIRVANQFRHWALTGGIRRYEIKGVYASWLKLALLVPKNLWGGYDLSLDTRLVSPPGGSHTLQRVCDPIKVDQLGMYVNWHNTNRNRTLATDEVGREPESANQICRLKRATQGTPVCQEWFYEELF